MMTMKVKNEKKFLRTPRKILKVFLKFTLLLISSVLSASSKNKKYEPTMHDLTCGEKYLLSDEYFTPNPKPPKK